MSIRETGAPARAFKASALQDEGLGVIKRDDSRETAVTCNLVL